MCGCDIFNGLGCAADIAGCAQDCNDDTYFIGCLECLEAIVDCAVRLLKCCSSITINLRVELHVSLLHATDDTNVYHNLFLL